MALLLIVIQQQGSSVFKGLGSPLSLIVCPLTNLLLSLETRWSIILLEILQWSWTLLHSTSIRKNFMVPQGWCVVFWKVVVWLDVVASIPINKLSFLYLIETFMRKSVISRTFLPSTFLYSYFIIAITSSFFIVHPVHDCI